LEKAIERVDDGSAVDVVDTDIQKSFDTVTHSRLVTKTHAIKGKVAT